MKSKINVAKMIRYFFLFIVMAFTLAPLYLLVVNSMKSAAEFQTNPFSFPSHPLFSNFIRAWNEGGYAQAFLNSFLVGVITVIVVDFLAGACAYSLAKLHPKGENGILTYFLITMTISVSLCLVPLFYLWQTLHLMNTLTGLIIIYCGINLAFSITFLRSFFISIPDAILESARIDGCSEFGVLLKIVLPLAKPAFFTITLLTVLASWNEFFYANSFIQTDSLRTVATKYIAFTGQFSTEWNIMCAAGIITVLPMVVLYMLFQRNFVEGLTSGSVKG